MSVVSWPGHVAVERPTIITRRVPMREQAQAALRAITAMNGEQPRVFRRVADLARVQFDADGYCTLEQLNVDRLRVVCEDAADWVGVTPKGEQYPDYSPPEVIRYILAQGDWPQLPLLRQVQRTPTLLPDGRLLDMPGYDSASGMYLAFAPGLDVPPIPTAPSEDDAVDAARVLDEYLSDFEFATPADRSNAMGLMLTPLLRPLFGAFAPVPLFGIDAPVAGSGKGLLVDCTAIIASGKPAPIQPADGADAAEWRKRITAQLTTGVDVLHLDNLSEPLDDGSLCSALTNPDLWTDRILGTSLIARVPVTTTFAVSGNNLQIKNDMTRRVIPVRIDTRLERPDLRPLASFRYPGADQLRAAVMGHRGQLIAAGLTIGRRWLVAGKPPNGSPSMGSFESMTRVVGGALACAGVGDWLGNLDRFRAAQSDERAEWVAWIAAWYARFGTEPKVSRDLAATALSDSAVDASFRNSLPTLLKPLSELERNKLAISLGNALRVRVGNVFGEYRLNRLETVAHGGAAQWQVVPNEPRTHESSDAGNNVTSVTSVTIEPTPSSDDAGSAGDTGGDTHGDAPSGVELDSNWGGDTGDAGDTTSDAPPIEVRVAVPAPDLEVLTTASEVARHIPKLMAASSVAIDTETTALSPLDGRVRLVQLATRDGPVFVVDAFAVDVRALEPLFRSEGPRLVGHHLAFDLWHLWRAGLPIPPAARLFDTELASRVLDASAEPFGAQTLAALARRYLDQELPKDEQTSDWSQPELSLEQIGYAARDAAATYQVARHLHDRLKTENLLRAHAVEADCLPAMVWLADSGVAVDAQLWDAPARQALLETKGLYQELTRLAGTGGLPGDIGDFRFSTLNWSSPVQVLKLLHARGHDPRDSLGRESTAEEALLALGDADSFIDVLLQHREASKRDSVYGLDYLSQHLAADGRIHADFHQLGAATGRMSCRRPNLQQIPRSGGYRQAFRPPDGRVLVKADFSQLQLAIAAEVSGDRTMLKAFQTGADIHTLTASKVLGVDPAQVSKDQRQAAKAINFGFLFGMQSETFRRHARGNYGVNVDSSTAEQMRAAYFETYRGIAAWHRRPENRDRWDKHRQCFVSNPIDVRVPSGRRRLQVSRVPEKLNSGVQMMEADGLKSALGRLWQTRARVPSAKLVLVIHDEVVVEVDRTDAELAAAWLRDEMEAGMQQWLAHVPVTVDTTVARDWAGTPLQEQES